MFLALLCTAATSSDAGPVLTQSEGLPNPPTATDPPIRNVSEPADRNLTEPAAEKLTEFAAENVTEPAAEKVTEPAAKNVTEPAAKRETAGEKETGTVVTHESNYSLPPTTPALEESRSESSSKKVHLFCFEATIGVLLFTYL